MLWEINRLEKSGIIEIDHMDGLGLGACLADDMGLGKTVQVIALLNYLRTKTQEKALLIVPASLIGNWISEIARFTPCLKYYVIHPSENKNLEKQDSACVEEYDLCITTYGMLLKYDWLKNATWDSLILDEAQAIKNPGTKQTKAVKQLKASYKVAMTGTPIENRLADLWSLFDFLNKGLLGSAREFTDFTRKLPDTPEGYARLKRVVSPFILRRLKTDKNVISDLPEKIENPLGMNHSVISVDPKARLDMGAADAALKNRDGAYPRGIQRFHEKRPPDEEVFKVTGSQQTPHI